MNKTNLTEYADYLLQTALYKTSNIDEAQDLVQETLISALVAIEQKKPIDNLKNWLVTVLNRKYYDMLRHKYRKPTVSMDVIAEIPHDIAIYENIEKSEDAENIRRCLAYLTKLYREVMVRFYIHGQSVNEIATALDISENTVKSRLDRGRTHIRKEFNMENFTNNSYEPETLWLANSGECGLNNEPFSLVGQDRIPMNILILAYKTPLTIPEIAKAMGIATAYIEPIVERLINGELMKKVSDRVYSDFIIYKEDDRTANLSLERELADKLYKDIWEIVEEGLAELRKQDFYKSQKLSQSLKLESFFSIRTVHTAVNNVRNEMCGGGYSWEDTPVRPNGGKWYAMGNHYSPNYDWNNNEFSKYCISGEAGYNLVDYCGLKQISLLFEYDTNLGKTHQGYGNDLFYPMSGIDAHEDDVCNSHWMYF